MFLFLTFFLDCASLLALKTAKSKLKNSSYSRSSCSYNGLFFYTFILQVLLSHIESLFGETETGSSSNALFCHKYWGIVARQETRKLPGKPPNGDILLYWLSINEPPFTIRAPTSIRFSRLYFLKQNARK